MHIDLNDGNNVDINTNLALHQGCTGVLHLSYVLVPLFPELTRPAKLYLNGEFVRK